MPKPIIITESATGRMLMLYNGRSGHLVLEETLSGSRRVDGVRLSRAELVKVCKAVGMEVKNGDVA